jgi:hypothetical protein
VSSHERIRTIASSFPQIFDDDCNPGTVPSAGKILILPEAIGASWFLKGEAGKRGRY